MATTFTTWADLYTNLLNALADWAAGGNFVTLEYTIKNDDSHREMKYRTIEELKKGIEWVKTMASLETGTAVRRTYGKQGGGKRW